MKRHSDSGDYTYQQQPQPLRQFDIQPWPEKAQARMDELEKRIRHSLLFPNDEAALAARMDELEKRIRYLEKIVHLMLNPEEA